MGPLRLGRAVTTVLLVDDDRALRKLLRAYLEAVSISVLEAASGEECLATIERSAPTLVLLDVRLPGIDGFEVLRRLELAGRAVPVILVTRSKMSSTSSSATGWERSTTSSSRSLRRSSEGEGVHVARGCGCAQRPHHVRAGDGRARRASDARRRRRGDAHADRA